MRVLGSREPQTLGLMDRRGLLTTIQETPVKALEEFGLSFKKDFDRKI
jgi:hypothetical protein